MPRPPKALRPERSAADWFGAEVRHWREHRDLTQRELAERLWVSTSLIGRIETADRQCSPGLTRRLDEVLDTGGALARAKRLITVVRQEAVDDRGEPGETDHGVGFAHQRIVDDVKRRHFLAAAGTGLAAAVPALALDDLRRLVDTFGDLRRYVDAEAVDILRRRIHASAAQDPHTGPLANLPPLLGAVAAINEAITHARAPHRQPLLALGATAAELVGWFYRDAGQPRSAERWLDQAWSWAEAAQDRPMQSYLLLKKAQLAWDQRDAPTMLALARGAQDPRWSPYPRVRAEALQQEARAIAMIDGDADQAQHLMDAGAKLLAAPNSQETVVGAHYNDTLFQVQTAICLTEAGKPRIAVDLYARHVSVDTFAHRDYGYMSALAASALALAGEPDAAATTALESLEIATATGSGRTLGELRRLVPSLAPWSRLGRVRRFRGALGAGG